MLRKVSDIFLTKLGIRFRATPEKPRTSADLLIGLRQYTDSGKLSIPSCNKALYANSSSKPLFKSAIMCIPASLLLKLKISEQSWFNHSIRVSRLSLYRRRIFLICSAKRPTFIYWASAASVIGEAF